MNKALFLDRDGVLNRELGRYTFRPEEFEILPEVAPALKLARKKGYMLIVISNQGGIARGEFTKGDVEACHKKLTDHLLSNGIRLDDIYYCPHHDGIGKCLCRKPGSLMLEKALARFSIDSSSSYFIGDSQRDQLAAISAGVNPIAVQSNEGILKFVQQLP
jgi:D-glycero-D-manno-heptose 1,7-bisphosphate phosphatase